ncbi:MAG: Hydrogenase-4 component B [Firmicutes bacterium]|nr:Hydrogenase-4 component B [candidate division NPL-UPA2 bacterium]
MYSLDLLLLLPILLPLFGAGLVFLSRARKRVQDALVVGTVLLTFAGTAAIYLLNPEHRLQLVFFHLVDYGLSFRPTNLGILFALLSAGLWALITIYAISYMRHSHSQTRFSSFLLVSLSGCLGVFLAGDYFTLFLFFEIMTFAAYPLVIHDEDDEAMRAGDSYLYMGVAGGLVLLLGILMLVWSTGTADIVPALDMLQGGAISPYVVALVFLIGFGVKAGLVPLHVWIPHTYPVAPAPATALLSGVMGKTGFYGILSVLTVTLSSPLPSKSIAAIPMNIGFALIWVALLTILCGAVMALLQKNVKRLLAYSSISQMGYVMLAVGCAAYLGAKGGLPYTAAVFHAFNHAVFKAGLFLMMGSVYMRTQSLDLGKLGGMAKVLPFTALTTLVATLAVIGVPGLSGFGSKKLVQYGIEKAAAYHGEQVLTWIAPLFILGSALTAAYLIKLYYGVFLGKYRGQPVSGAKEGVTIPAVLGLVAASIVAVGLFPERMMGLMSRSAAGTVVNFGVMTEQLATVKLWTVSSYTAVAVPVAIGVLIFFAARHFKFGAGTVPWWLSVEALIYRPVTQGFLRFCCRYVTRVEGGICDLYDRSGSVSHSVLRRVRKLDDMLDEGYEASQRTTTLVVEQARGLEHGIEEAYARVGHQVATLPTGAASVEGEITAVYTRVGQAAVDTTRRLRNEAASDNHATEQQPEVWNPQNVTLGSLVVAAVMFVVLVVLYAVGIRVLR